VEAPGMVARWQPNIAVSKHIIARTVMYRNRTGLTPNGPKESKEVLGLGRESFE